MSTLQAIPTQHGIDILNSELKNTVTKYRLIGALTHDAPSESLYSFYENTIETSYYDDNGVLTFILNLPIEQHFDEYLHQIHVLDSSNQSVIECSTPKVALPKGIGGMVTLKAAISGEAGQVIFKHSEFVTETELNELYLPPIYDRISQRDKSLMNLPIYPEMLTTDKKLALGLTSTTLTIDDGQSLRLRGWFYVSTTDIDLASRQFQVDLAKTYHLRYDRLSGFRLLDLSNVTYNPDSAEHIDERFDSTFDDVLLALVDKGVITTYINTPNLPVGNLEYIDRSDSFSIVNGTQTVLSLTIDKQYARKIKAKAIYKLYVSDTAGGSNYGLANLEFNGVKIQQTPRVYVGTTGGANYVETFDFETEITLSRLPSELKLLLNNEGGGFFVNTSWNSGWPTVKSYLKVEAQ